MATHISGVQCLLMTPFTADGSAIDQESLERVIDHVIAGGAHGLVVAGKIGEFESLSMEERRRVMHIAAEHVAGRVPAGVGIINAPYDEGLTLGRWAREAGLDYVMSRPPTDGDTVSYYRELATTIPVMIYDQGARGELSVEDTIAPLARELEGIAAVKISGLPEKTLQMKRLVSAPSLCGWDMMSLLSYELGADGVISASATLMPQEEVRLREIALHGKLAEAREIFYTKVLPVLLYCMFDPYAYSACKYVLHWLGIIRWPAVREPYAVPINEYRQIELRYVLGRVGILPPA